MTNFGNVLTAMVTPFKSDLSVNYAMAEKLAVHLANNGSDGLVLHGTTGESPTLTHEEEYELYRVVKKALKGTNCKIVAGTGSNSTATSIKSTKEAEKIGVDGIMLVAPYYNKPPQEGFYQHFKAVAENTGLPIIVYNIPGRSAKNIETETMARLAEIKNIVAVKEASGNLDQVAAVRKATPKDFLIYSGDDNLTLPIIERGGVGVISVASHLVGKELNQMVALALAGKKREAQAIHDRLMPLFEAIFVTSNPIPVKAALAMIGWPVGGLRLPLIEANEEEKAVVRKVLEDLKILK
ncbi:4-hydroxy-tetrahydrodipicolinate synthase [candidate division WOR-1 bacterium RIFOXYB2_FULL_42_35]|uniref:4-hydroxy-tetrahydrodipicolinate synthase n=1 Tax=candidate division WOR-1 bacterium RIFOXYC2_FULL_41_25 TaxID=1802586 RepID=A0A1F4TRN5_UNCSA|nr:MAG: 4-hydroxy-tetrahydrodipicolinate synthase [candidate division WOR-1 bacterium RIFOXYA2_FULL_41_14]OGC25768.1 MAG: 4-hydroxy-tetrahydrodipicolinate synthase [candidate division WOR-1 bacterium RIFOXYB2_FULL_42_35]OGC35402.1 MAG: 4-hydroxy-tetrahydrodipicolinate synthase [candidate division WOR-1 bacterium RIFOXYC2_FULL_41_25]